MGSKIQLVGFGLLIAVGTTVTVWLARTKVWLVTTSPNGAYTVRMTGDPKAPKRMFAEHETRFDLVKDGKWVARNVLVDSYDWFDSDFETEHRWISDSTVRFGYPGTIADESDSITLVNNTDQPISYLKLSAADRFLLFDLAPHASATFAMPHPPTGSYIAAEGTFATGRAIREYGVNFSYDQKVKAGLQYCIWVGNEGLEIGSTALDGHVGFPNPKPVPKVAACGAKSPQI